MEEKRVSWWTCDINNCDINSPLNKVRLNQLEFFHQMTARMIGWFRIKEACCNQAQQRHYREVIWVWHAVSFHRKNLSGKGTLKPEFEEACSLKKKIIVNLKPLVNFSLFSQSMATHRMSPYLQGWEGWGLLDKPKKCLNNNLIIR